MITDWIMIIITAIYVIATIIICVSNYKSAKLSKKSNEMSLIQTIVTNEQRRLIEFKKACDDFVQSASLGYQYEQIGKKADEIEIRNSIENSFIHINRCLNIELKKHTLEYERVMHCANCFYKVSVDMCKWLCSEYDEKESKGEAHARLKKMMEVQQHFNEAKEDYILKREQMLSQILLKNLSIDDVQKILSDE